ncbi:MAG: hypothetical protein J2P31_09640, partial [Blastocatellia bacterium]|nr:hypothetical protein [Blastocatellia bacterium]
GTLMALVTWIFITAFILILGANLSVKEVLPRAWTGLLPPVLRRQQAWMGNRSPGDPPGDPRDPRAYHG